MAGELEASICGALLGALAGGLVSVLAERLQATRSRKQVLLDQFGDLSIEFSADVNTYWSAIGADLALQSRIISGHHKIRVKLRLLGFDLGADLEVRRLVKELFQFSTGGTFATRAHVPDGGRAREVDRRLQMLEDAIFSEQR